MNTSTIDVPSIDAIRANRARLGDLVITTPIRQLVDDAFAVAVCASTRVWLKEELFQRTGSFKPRGALSVMLDLDAAALSRGVTGVSAGNHAISLGHCARALRTTAKVVMPSNANPFRIQVCRELGAVVEPEGADTLSRSFAAGTPQAISQDLRAGAHIGRWGCWQQSRTGQLRKRYRLATTGPDGRRAVSVPAVG